MKSRYLPMAGLLIIGIFGASGSAAPAIHNSISGANIEIAQIAELIDIELKGIGSIADQDAIDGAIGTKAINTFWIEDTEISDPSLIAIENIIDRDIQIDLIEANITNIAA